MNIPFHRRIKIVPGMCVNLNKGVPSLSVRKGPFTVNVDKKGVRSTASFRRTGVSVNKMVPWWKYKPGRNSVWAWILGVAAAFIILTFLHSNSTPNHAAQPTFTPALRPMTAEERKQQEAGWEQFKEADRKERELLKKQRAERRARYEAGPDRDFIIGATPSPR